MHSVLFIAYDFQPCANLGGSIRSVKFVEQLPHWGWRPVVLGLDTVEAREQGELFPCVHRVRSLAPFYWPYQATPYGWAASVWWRIKELVKEQKFDLIYVSCPPFPQTLSCASLKRRFKLPLVLDFRDVWSLDPYREGSRLKKFMYRRLFPVLEHRVLNHTDRLILNTPSALQAYQELYPQYATRMSLIPNGFDEQDFTDPPPAQENQSTMRLLYCGRFGIGGRDARSLLIALRDLFGEGLKISLAVVGAQPRELAYLITELKLGDMVLLEGQVPHAQAVARMYTSDILVLYQEPSGSEVQPVAGKTYEYLRTGKPILSIAPRGDNQNLIGRYAKRCEQVTDAREESISNAIRRLYSDWQLGNLTMDTKTNEEYKACYERNALTGRLAEVFNEVVDEEAEW